MPAPTAKISDETRRQSRLAVDRIKDMAIGGVTREKLPAIQKELEGLAMRRELFLLQDFPPPPGPTNILYEIVSDDDGQYTLYVSSANRGKETPPHNHATWAAIVAIAGEELNRLYRRYDQGNDNSQVDIRLEREHIVKPGHPIGLMPDDIHSIHVLSDEPALHIHLYGRRLPDLKGRLQFDLERREAKYFPPNPNIR